MNRCVRFFLRYNVGLLERTFRSLNIRWRQLLAQSSPGSSLRGIHWTIPVYLVAVLLFFAKIVFSDSHHFPWDIVDFHYPAQVFLSTSVRHGVYPLWNPHVMLGYPIMGDLNASPFYPLSLISWFLPRAFPLPLRVLELTLIGHILVAGLSVFALCRLLGTRYSSAIIAGLIFMFAGFFPARVQNDGWVRTAAWLPLTLLLFIRALQTRRLSTTIAGGLIFSLSILAGHWQTCLYTAYLLLFWLVWQWVFVERVPNTGFIKRAVFQTLIYFSVALGVSAIQILPAAELFNMAARGQLSFTDSVAGAVTFRSILTLFLPRFYSDSGPDLAQDISLTHIYCGTIAIGLFAVGCFAKRAEGGSYRRFFIALFIIATSLSVGSLLPFYGLAYSYIPGFQFFRRPYSFVLYGVLAFAILSAFGMDAITEVGRRHKRLIAKTQWSFGLVLILYLMFFVIGVAVLSMLTTIEQQEPMRTVTLGVSRLTSSFGTMIPFVLITLVLLHVSEKGGARGWLGQACLVIFVFVDLAFFNSNRIFNAARGDPRTLLSNGQILGVALPEHLAKGRNHLGDGRVALAGYGGAFDNAASAIGFESYGGYNPLKLKRYSEFVGLVDSPNSQLLSLANVRYILSSPPFLSSAHPPTLTRVSSALSARISLPSGALDMAHFRLLETSPNRWYLLYENTRVLPRIFIAKGYVVVPDSRARLALLKTKPDDLANTLVLEEEPQGLSGNCANTEVLLEFYGANQLTLQHRSNAACLVFVGDTWYPGWRAYVDGTPVRILRANHLFRAVPVPAGHHTIEMRFQPWSFRLGAGLSVTTLLIIGLVALVSKLRKS